MIFFFLLFLLKAKMLLNPYTGEFNRNLFRNCAFIEYDINEPVNVENKI